MKHRDHRDTEGREEICIHLSLLCVSVSSVFRSLLLSGLSELAAELLEAADELVEVLALLSGQRDLDFDAGHQSQSSSLNEIIVSSLPSIAPRDSSRTFVSLSRRTLISPRLISKSFFWLSFMVRRAGVLQVAPGLHSEGCRLAGHEG